MKTCSNCGCKVYNGHCVNCHEEIYIMEQNSKNDEPIGFSNEFWNKVKKQEKEAKEILRLEKLKKQFKGEENV